MRKLLLALLLPATALVATGCGDSCATKGAEARVTGTPTCAVKSAVPITINVTPACASCAEDTPKCDISPLSSNKQQLDIQVRECDSNKSCSNASCSFGAVSCAFTPPAASGTIDVLYRTGGTTGTLTLQLNASNTGTSCTI